jgi:hypothetical protein
MAGFEELEVWNRAVELSAEVFMSVRDSREYAFRDQIARSCCPLPPISRKAWSGRRRPTS